VVKEKIKALRGVGFCFFLGPAKLKNQNLKENFFLSGGFF